jgi:hypothetical protein
MRILKLVPWLAAWSAWAWLGVGLHRELPRELGPPLAQLPIKAPKPLEFVGDSNVIAVAKGQWAPSPPEYELYDALTGRLIGERKCPPSYDLAAEAYHSLRRGVLLHRYRREPHEPLGTTGLERIDVMTNERKRLTNRDFSSANLHGEKPLLIVVEPNDGGERIRVLDINTGEELCCINDGQVHAIDSTPFFLPDAKRLAVPITRKPESSMLEIWTIAKPSVMEASQPHPASQRLSSVSNNGLYARRHHSEFERIEVVDLYSGNVVFTTPSDKPGAKRRSAIADQPPVISDDGRLIFDYSSETFWNVENGRLVWQSADYENAVPVMKDHLQVRERWSRWWSPTNVRMDKFTTTAFRNYETGRVDWRVRGFRMPQYLNGPVTLAADAFGNVYRWPPPVNGPLLAACQAVLALPIVMTWFVLRWLKRRAVRRRGLLTPSFGHQP